MNSSEGTGRTGKRLITIRVSRETAAELLDLRAAARESGLSAEQVREICYAGHLAPRVVEERTEEEEFFFDEEALYVLRRVHELHEVEGINMRGVGMILTLLRRMEEIEGELRYFRTRL